MKDLHSHFLYGADDGSKSLEETKEMLKNAYECGVTDIVFTPHYIDESKYVSEVSENEKIFNTIKEEAEHLNINISFFIIISYILVNKQTVSIWYVFGNISIIDTFSIL